METIRIKYCPITIANVLGNNRCVVYCQDIDAMFFFDEDLLVCQWNGGEGYHNQKIISPEVVEQVLGYASEDSWQSILLSFNHAFFS